MIRKAISAITGAREWLTLLAVAAAAAWLYAQFATVRNDRNRLLASANVICASAGAEFAAGEVEIRNIEAGETKRVRVARGQLCLRNVRQLAAFERDTNAQSARILADAMAEQNHKTGVDAAHARQAAEAARAAAEKMGVADAAITGDDRVGAAWFDALNNVAGLRAPPR